MINITQIQPPLVAVGSDERRLFAGLLHEIRPKSVTKRIIATILYKEQVVMKGVGVGYVVTFAHAR